MYSEDLRWRAVALRHIYDIDVQSISDILGAKPRTIRRWYKIFLSNGTVVVTRKKEKTARWPNEVLTDVKAYIKYHPTFYIDELQSYLKDKFPYLLNVSTSTICRAIHFDLNYSRKVLSKHARESIPAEREIYEAKLKTIYSFPEQLIFVDETSKDGRHAYRRYAWSLVGKPAVVKLPFRRGERVSVLAALDHRGFCGWSSTPGTYTRRSFHENFCRIVLPQLNPWPLPRSIVIMDNAKIHMYPELEVAIGSVGARLLFLPPYSPDLNPIEYCFGLLKRWIQRHANLVFPLYPTKVLEVAIRRCVKESSMSLYSHCGYINGGLDSEKICK